MSTEEWLNLIPNEYRKYARAAILEEAEKAFRVGYLRGLWEEGIGRSEEQPTEETYINNLFNNDK